MSNTIKSGNSVSLNVQAGEKLILDTITGTFTATITAGAGTGTVLATDSSGGGSFGPYASAVTILVKCSADGLTDYEVGTAPDLDYEVTAKVKNDPLTGRITNKLGGIATRIGDIVDTASATTLTANVRNPLQIASVNEPVEIRVMFDQGVCKDPALITVSGSSGSIPWQWEPGVNPLTNTAQALWPDGSIRAGSVWILSDFTAGQTKVFTVSVGSSVQVAGAQNVIYGTESATVEYFETPKLRSRFFSDRGWMPKSLRDPTRSNIEFNATGNGPYHRYTIGGVNKFSFTPADMTSQTKALVGSGNFGYGVVFQEFEASFAWVAEPNSTVTTRFRHFANNRIKFNNRMYCASTTSSADRGISFYVETGDSTAPTSAYSFESGWADYTYSDGRRLLTGMSTIQTESEVLQMTGETSLYTCSANQVRLGFALNALVIPAGSYFSFSGYTAVGYTSGSDEALRCNNPILARATGLTIPDLKRIVAANLAKIARAWIPVEAADSTYSYGGSQAVARLALAKYEGRQMPVSQAHGLFLKWCANNNITPTSTATYTALWGVANKGFEYIGPATSVISKLRHEYLSLGDTTSAARMETYIHALADFCVAAEITSGGSGQMLIRGNNADNFNAEASAMLMLAESLAITSNATRLATMTRISTRFLTSAKNGNKTQYNYGGAGVLSQTVSAMRAAYHFYNTCMAIRSEQAYPLLASQIDYRQFALEYTTALSIADEAKWNKQQTRRGLSSNLLAAAYTLANSPNADAGDWQASSDLIAHLVDNIHGPIVVDKSIDGWMETFDGTVSAVWGGSDSPCSGWHWLYDLSS